MASSDENQSKQKRNREKEKQKVKDLEQQVKLLERKIELQAAILESIGDVNRVLASDDEGKKLLWTNGYPHNLKPEIAEKIQQILKKKRSRGGGKAALLRHVLAPGSELPK